jgi:hypothetical protein
LSWKGLLRRTSNDSASAPPDVGNVERGGESTD